MLDSFERTLREKKLAFPPLYIVQCLNACYENHSRQIFPCSLIFHQKYNSLYLIQATDRSPASWRHLFKELAAVQHPSFSSSYRWLTVQNRRLRNSADRGIVGSLLADRYKMSCHRCWYHILITPAKEYGHPGALCYKYWYDHPELAGHLGSLERYI